MSKELYNYDVYVVDGRIYDSLDALTANYKKNFAKLLEIDYQNPELISVEYDNGCLVISYMRDDYDDDFNEIRVPDEQELTVKYRTMTTLVDTFTLAS